MSDSVLSKTPTTTSSGQALPQKKGRLEWLDAMRGFTMLLVVSYHVAQMCFGINLKTSSSMPLLVLFRMPLFFFVSGFLAYKAGMLWTPGRLGMMVWKKFKIQVLPTVVFLCFFIVVRLPHFWAGLKGAMLSPTKYGYWFTWALLIMFVVYYLMAFVEQRIACLGRTRSEYPQTTAPVEAEAPHAPWVIITLWVVSLGVYETAYLPKVFTYPKNPWLNYLSLIEVIYFFHFFLFGNLVHRYWTRVERLFDSRWFFPVVVLVAFVCGAEALKWHTLHLAWANLPRTVGMYALMLIVIMTFRYYRDNFSHRTRAGRLLQFIGTRTLDIYLLHFILMPRMPFLGPWFDAHGHNFVLEQVATLFVAAFVVAFCCLASSVLRVSPLLRKYLFGRK